MLNQPEGLLSTSHSDVCAKIIVSYILRLRPISWYFFTQMNSKKFWAALFVLILGSFMFYCSSIGNGDNFDVKFVREVPSQLSVDYLSQVLAQVQKWPLWFYSASRADEVNFRGDPYPRKDQALEVKGLIRMAFDPHKGESRKFELTYEVMEYIPKQRVRIRVISDSKGKLTHLFEDLEWTFELVPQGSGTLIRGTETARTASWRARLFSRLVPSIFLNQVFYPDLMILAKINDPDVVAPYPDPQQ
jgi:hypothetical protein